MITLAMRRTYRDITTASSSDIADDENHRGAVSAGELPAYQQVQQQRQSRDPTVVPSTTTSASADNSIPLRHIVTPSGGEEFVDILQVQQLLLENAGVSSASSVSDSGRGGVLVHTQRPAAAAEYPHLGLEAAIRGHMLFDSYPPTATAVPPTQSHRHHHHHPPQPPPPLPPYYYANYTQQHQQQPSNVEELFALWLGSSGTGRSYCFIYDCF